MNILQINRQKGLTIIEMMVSIVLSLLLMIAAIQIFTANKQSYRLVEASSRVQENGRFAVAFLRPVIRVAGFTGCANVKKGASFKNRADSSKYGSSSIQAAIDTFGNGESIRGYTYTSGPTLPADLVNLGLSRGTATGDIWEGTANEVLVIKYGGACPGGNVVQPMPSTAANLKIANATACNIQQNDLVIVSDCQSSDLFGVTNNPQSSGGSKDTLAHSNAINTANTLSKAYGEDASVYKLNVDIFYIGRGSSGEPALFRRTIVNGAYQNQELVEGVERMTAVFGVDSDATSDGMANYYVNSATVAAGDWDKIASVRLNLTVRSKSNNVTVDQDKLRHTFTTTIKVRNSL